MLRNEEILIYAVIAVAIAAVASVSCFTITVSAGILCLLGCTGIFTACIVFTLRRYRKIAELSSYLQKITNGMMALDIRENAEGELSILKDEIYKATIALTEQADALKNDKLELASALSDISHQLKVPLTSLSIMADLLSSESLPPKKRSEFLDSVRAGLDRMEWLVLSLLKLARLDADAVRLKKEEVHLSTLVERALAPMLIPIEVKGQTYKTGGEDASLPCDFHWTVEALGNIIKNAVENTPEGGRLEISYGANPLYAFIAIRDDGPGIDKEDLPHLFKRFYRGKNANRESAGIGLAMSLAIMRKQNGDIEAASDQGSTFTLKFYSIPK